jgi:hypothetical protein
VVDDKRCGYLRRLIHEPCWRRDLVSSHSLSINQSTYSFISHTTIKQQTPPPPLYKTLAHRLQAMLNVDTLLSLRDANAYDALGLTDEDNVDYFADNDYVEDDDNNNSTTTSTTNNNNQGQDAPTHNPMPPKRP